MEFENIDAILGCVQIRQDRTSEIFGFLSAACEFGLVPVDLIRELNILYAERVQFHFCTRPFQKLQVILRYMMVQADG